LNQPLPRTGLAYSRNADGTGLYSADAVALLKCAGWQTEARRNVLGHARELSQDAGIDAGRNARRATRLLFFALEMRTTPGSFMNSRRAVS
jgi:hypothetical protein